MLSAVAQYIGAAIAVVLFDEVEPQTVAWFRIMGAAIALLAGLPTAVATRLLPLMSNWVPMTGPVGALNPEPVTCAVTAPLLVWRLAITANGS